MPTLHESSGVDLIKASRREVRYGRKVRTAHQRSPAWPTRRSFGSPSDTIKNDESVRRAYLGY